MKILGATNVGFADYDVVLGYSLAAIATASILFCPQSHIDGPILFVFSGYNEYSCQQATRLYER